MWNIRPCSNWCWIHPRDRQSLGGKLGWFSSDELEDPQSGSFPAWGNMSHVGHKKPFCKTLVTLLWDPISFENKIWVFVCNVKLPIIKSISCLANSLDLLLVFSHTCFECRTRHSHRRVNDPLKGKQLSFIRQAVVEMTSHKASCFLLHLPDPKVTQLFQSTTWRFLHAGIFKAAFWVSGIPRDYRRTSAHGRNLSPVVMSWPLTTLQQHCSMTPRPRAFLRSEVDRLVGWFFWRCRENLGWIFHEGSMHVTYMILIHILVTHCMIQVVCQNVHVAVSLRSCKHFVPVSTSKRGKRELRVFFSS